MFYGYIMISMSFNFVSALVFVDVSKLSYRAHNMKRQVFLKYLNLNSNLEFLIIFHGGS